MSVGNFISRVYLCVCLCICSVCNFWTAEARSSFPVYTYIFKIPRPCWVLRSPDQGQSQMKQIHNSPNLQHAWNLLKLPQKSRVSQNLCNLMWGPYQLQATKQECLSALCRTIFEVERWFFFYFYLSPWGEDPNLAKIQFFMGVGDGYVFGCIFFFANFWTFFLYPYTPSPPPPPPHLGGEGGGRGRRWVCFWMHYFFANFGTFFLYSYTPLPPPQEEGGWGMFLDAFFLLFFEYF